MPKSNPSAFQKGDDYPVEQINWYDAILYIMRLNRNTGLCFRSSKSENLNNKNKKKFIFNKIFGYKNRCP